MYEKLCVTTYTGRKCRVASAPGDGSEIKFAGFDEGFEQGSSKLTSYRGIRAAVPQREITHIHQQSQYF